MRFTLLVLFLIEQSSTRSITNFTFQAVALHLLE